MDVMGKEVQSQIHYLELLKKYRLSLYQHD